MVRGFVSMSASTGAAVFSGAAAMGAAGSGAADLFVFVDQISAADSNADAVDRTGGVASSAALSEGAPSCATDGSFPFMFATVLTPSESDDAMPRAASPAQALCSRELSRVFTPTVLIGQRASRQSTSPRHMIVFLVSPSRTQRTKALVRADAVPRAPCLRSRTVNRSDQDFLPISAMACIAAM
jgi:hypothetical protein